MGRARPNYVYVASSWRNSMQTAVCAALKSVGIDHYDFKNPPNKSAFHWSEVMPSYQRSGADQVVPVDEYLKGLQDSLAIDGFKSDMDALRKADSTILVLPCGRSAHLELGYAVGMGQDTAILLDGELHPNKCVTPELMYKMVGYLAPTLFDLLGWLGVDD